MRRGDLHYHYNVHRFEMYISCILLQEGQDVTLDVSVFGVGAGSGGFSKIGESGAATDAAVAEDEGAAAMAGCEASSNGVAIVLMSTGGDSAMGDSDVGVDTEAVGSTLRLGNPVTGTATGPEDS